MSTRRARIKAVAALPPRRKNADSNDSSKSKLNPTKDIIEKGLKSPRTPRSHSSSSPVIKTPPPLIPIASKVHSADKLLSPKVIPQKIAEKLPGTTSTTKNDVIIFTSPQSKRSPEKRCSTSPAIQSPKPVINGIQKCRDVYGNEKQKFNAEENEKGKSPAHKEKDSNVPDYYSIPSVPESITNDDVMDGIIPLQAASNDPKPIDQLMSEIISENAEALFDPIVPLPSPSSKVRLKLRPAPRLGPHRRNSIQGSASESEDETRRALLHSAAAAPTPQRLRCDSYTSHSTQHSAPNREVNRVRNDSVCSSVSQATVQPPPATSPLKEKLLSKARRQEMGKRMWRRRRETVKRDAMTMYDLIFYNPTTNPIIPDQDELQAKEANAKEEAERIANAKAQESEDDADEPPAAEAAPVPQIKLGPNGEIILDEKSLVIKQSDNRKVSSVVREGAWGGSGGRYKRSARTAEWSAAETVRFYRALAAVGTDFSLMAQLFPGRARKDLKLKFKKEERLNGGQVDKALRSATSWDVCGLQNEFKEERKDAADRAERERERLLESKKAERERLKTAREYRVRQSKGAKALESFVVPLAKNSDITADAFIRRAEALKDMKVPTDSELTANAFIQRAIATRAQAKRKAKKRRNHEDDVVPTLVPNSTTLKSSTPTPFATLTLLNQQEQVQRHTQASSDMATISRVEHQPTVPTRILNNMHAMPSVPSNIETGSLVVLRVNDPKSSSKTMLQTYIAHGEGKLTPVALPSTFLNSVVGYMKKGTPKSTISTASSPQLASPSSVASHDSRTSTTSSIIQMSSSPTKKQRHNSYTITPL